MTDNRTETLVDELKKSTEALITELTKVADLYYQGEGSPLTDDEYDEKILFLRDLIVNQVEYNTDKRISDLLEGSVAAGSTPSKKDNLVTHSVPMLSLDKANSMTEIKSWLDKIEDAGSTMMRVQAKLDGFAIEARYVNKVGVEVSTRGDGSVGEDISYLLNHPDISIVGLPSSLKIIENCSLRGELFARQSQFDKLNNARFAATNSRLENSRNGVVGVVKKGKSDLGYKAELTFCVYSVLIDGEYHDLDDLKVAHEDVITINELSSYEYANAGGSGDLTARDFDELSDVIRDFGEKRVDFDIPTDGAVIKPIEESRLYNAMGNTAHHPKAFIAFKYPSEKQPATVLDVVFSVGKTGRVTPTAIVTPTNLSGVTVSRASCHNFNWLKEKNVRIGSTVMITRANDVIPAISSVLIAGDNKPITVPKHCPECNTELVAEDLKNVKCPNPKCPSVFFFKMRSATSKQGLDIEGLNNVGLKALCESGIMSDVADLFTLTVNDLKDLPMGETSTGNVRKFGKVKGAKIISHIKTAKDNTPAYKLLNAMGFNGVGPSTAKLLLANLGSIGQLMNASLNDLTDIPGLGTVKTKYLIEEQKTIKEVYNKLLTLNVKMDNGLATKVTEKGHFAISGKVPEGFANRGAFTDYMATLGWVFDSAPKTTTTVMLGNETDTSSKIQKAKKLKIKIVNPDDYKTIL